MKLLKILYVCAELSPFVSTGGLADVSRALPRALRALGHDVRIALPCYAGLPADIRGERTAMCVADLGAKTAHGALRTSAIPGGDIPLYLVEHEQYFGRDYPYGYGATEYEDNAERFCFFCLALLHGVAQTGWRPDIVHCHDWHTAVIPAYIKTRLAQTTHWRRMPTLLTIHNLAFQGRYRARFLPYTGLSADLFTPDCLEFYGDLNLMKAGIALASQINTVSPTYAREIQTPACGEGLDGFLRTRANSLSGILNGVDYEVWNPRTDPLIERRYSAENLAGKRACKAALRKRLGLPATGAPLFGMVTRLYWQKGIDLLMGALDAIMARGIQLAVLGSGDPYYEELLTEKAKVFTGQMRLLLQYDAALSHQIEAGSDFFLMPSHFEPCGLSQMYSLAYGTVPIVRQTGGLADTVRDITPANLRKGIANGIVFREAAPEALQEAVERALALYSTPETLRRVRVAGMNEDFSWDVSSRAYVNLYLRAIARP